MRPVLVIFGTTHGQAARVAQAITTRLRYHGFRTAVVNAARSDPAPELFDAIIVVASVHAGGYQRAIRDWVARHAGALNDRTTAFVSVCLGVLQHQPAVDRDLRGIIDALLASTTWQPTEIKSVAGALKYTRYNPLMRWLMKRIAAKAGGSVDTSRDHEYTDWADLERFADVFGERLLLLHQSNSAPVASADQRQLRAENGVDCAS